jgi:enoyl-CoA hydratase/carnithine racemase
LLAALMEAIAEVRKNDAIHCIILDSAGDSFSAGQDLHDLRNDWKKKSVWGDHTGSTMNVTLALRNARQITIAAVRGYCLGGGMVLMNACDLAFAAEDAKIGMPEILRGSYGRSATPTLFHSRVPTKLAFYIQLTGRNFSGTEAARVGLVSGAVPLDQLSDYVMTTAREIASRNPVALEHAKIAAYSEMDLPFDLAIKADEAISHRMRFYTDPLSDVEGYLKAPAESPSAKKPKA